MSSQQNIHYFPGHMQRALRNLQGFVKSVDLIVELVDARAPLSSRNPLLDELCGNKARLLLLSKDDYADPLITPAWLDYFKRKGLPAISGNLKKAKFVSILISATSGLVKAKREKERRFGMKPQPIRVMVIGIPNVGKSTLINNVGGRKVAHVGNKAGVTKAEQWIKLNDDFTLLDTPGILPMNYPNRDQAIRLALLGSMREDVLPNVELAEHLLAFLSSSYPDCLKERFKIEDISSAAPMDVLAQIASIRLLLDGNVPSIEKASYLLIKEFKDGILGRFSLEKPQC